MKRNKTWKIQASNTECPTKILNPVTKLTATRQCVKRLVGYSTKVSCSCLPRCILVDKTPKHMEYPRQLSRYVSKLFKPMYVVIEHRARYEHSISTGPTYVESPAAFFLARSIYLQAAFALTQFASPVSPFQPGTTVRSSYPVGTIPRFPVQVDCRHNKDRAASVNANRLRLRGLK